MPRKNLICRISLSGFTLIELLVVISIIALLMSVLMPSLQKARESARTAKCLAHMKQLSTAVYTYSSTNDGWSLPCAKNGAGSINEASITWYQRLKNQKYIDYIPYDGTNLDSGDAGVLHCPSDKRPKAAYSYSANRHVMGFEGPHRNTYEAKMKVKRLSDMPRPSELIMLGERGGMNPGKQALLDDYWSPAGNSVWNYIGNDDSGLILGFFAGRHGRAKLRTASGNTGVIESVAMPFALADGHAAIYRGSVECHYNQRGAMPRSGFEIDKGYVLVGEEPDGWPKMKF